MHRKACDRRVRLPLTPRYSYHSMLGVWLSPPLDQALLPPPFPSKAPREGRFPPRAHNTWRAQGDTGPQVPLYMFGGPFLAAHCMGSSFPYLGVPDFHWLWCVASLRFWRLGIHRQPACNLASIAGARLGTTVTATRSPPGTISATLSAGIVAL